MLDMKVLSSRELKCDFTEGVDRFLLGTRVSGLILWGLGLRIVVCASGFADCQNEALELPACLPCFKRAPLKPKPPRSRRTLIRK